MKQLLLASVVALGALHALPAHALVFTLNQDGCTGGCGTGSTVFGTVSVVQGLNANSVIVTETLNAPSMFVKTGAGEALEFNLAGSLAITISGLSAGFSVGPAPATASTFGTFNYSIMCSGCGNGASNPLAGPLTFTVTGGVLTPSSFVANAGGYFFASDIIGPTGRTGNVASKGPGTGGGGGGGGTPTPEPVSMALLGTGLLGLGLVRSRMR